MSNYTNKEAASAAGEDISFSFGANWLKYVSSLDEEQLRQSAESLQESLDTSELRERSFLDAGCGSGVFSLSALHLGAAEVLSVDVDPNSIACATDLRSRETEDLRGRWDIKQGSLLDPAFLTQLKPADIVYSWGVLHHTGDMWTAIANVMTLVKPGGLFCLALYNYPRLPSVHMALKRLYNRVSRPFQLSLAVLYCVVQVSLASMRQRVWPWTYVRDYGKRSRGMNLWRDVEDWLGGLPCEFCDEDAVRAFAEGRGFILERTWVRGAGANNEYLLRRTV